MSGAAISFPSFYAHVNMLKYKLCVEKRLYLAQMLGRVDEAVLYYCEWLKVMAYVRQVGSVVSATRAVRRRTR